MTLARGFVSAAILFMPLVGASSLATGVPQIQYLQPQHTDRETLDFAIEYFQSGKYHEALLEFKKLSGRYTLNLRFRAYIGVCYYYDADYPNATATLLPLLDSISVFEPHEQSVYVYCAAESLYHTEKYAEAIALYERYTLLCYNNEKANAYDRLAMCHKALDHEAVAQEYETAAAACRHIWHNICNYQK